MMRASAASASALLASPDCSPLADHGVTCTWTTGDFPVSTRCPPEWPGPFWLPPNSGDGGWPPTSTAAASADGPDGPAPALVLLSATIVPTWAATAWAAP